MATLSPVAAWELTFSLLATTRSSGIKLARTPMEAQRFQTQALASKFQMAVATLSVAHWLTQTQLLSIQKVWLSSRAALTQFYTIGSLTTLISELISAMTPLP